MTALPLAAGLQVDAHHLANLLADASLFASADENRPALSMIRLTWTGEMLRADATDSYILASQEAEVVNARTGKPWERLLAPGDVAVIRALLKSCGKEEEVDVGVPLDGELTVARIGGMVVRCHEPEDVTYPSFDGLWPDETMAETASVAIRADLLGKVSKLAAAKDGAGVRFRFHPHRRAEAPLIWWRCGPATGLLMPMSIYDDPA